MRKTFFWGRGGRPSRGSKIWCSRCSRCSGAAYAVRVANLCGGAIVFVAFEWVVPGRRLDGGCGCGTAGTLVERRCSIGRPPRMGPNGGNKPILGGTEHLEHLEQQIFLLKKSFEGVGGRPPFGGSKIWCSRCSGCSEWAKWVFMGSWVACGAFW